ncbi:MAG: Tetratricopeptide 2 repeat protein [Caulobacter sp.]|nr:Tetratricopeptide 2 repeat protein [Caulobacter sp.]
MGARIVGLLLGLILGLWAWAVIVPHGPLGALLPWLTLGPFEPHRFFVGAAAAAFGAVIFVAALMPKDGGGSGGGGGGKRRGPAPPLAFDEEPSSSSPPPAEPMSASEPLPPVTLAQVSPAPPPPQPEPPARPPMAETGPGENFQAVRSRLHQAARTEDWPEAAALSRRLPALAANDTERALAAQDAGDLARSAGRLDDAADAYHEALSYARGVHTADPAQGELLAAALTNAGDMAQDEGRLDAAVEAYDEALELRRATVASGRADPPALHALSLSLERLADAREDRGHRTRALDLYKESFDIAGHLAAADPARYGKDLAATRERLAELESRIAG